MNSQITDVQVQELTDHIADKCEQMGLTPEQILDGIARSLISAATVFGTEHLVVTIDNIGCCQVNLEGHIS